MNYHLYSYRFAAQILEHPSYSSLRAEIIEVASGTPLPVFPKKSGNNSRLDVVQQVLNTYFDYEFSAARSWDYHPNATGIASSGLKADFKKTLVAVAPHDQLTVQAEVQFGNMSRWYSDIFKFQTSYSQGQIDIGICIVPMYSLAVRIDSNVVNYERVLRELPHAKMSITLPILVIGLEPDSNTAVYDLSQAKLRPRGRGIASAFVGRGTTENRYRVLNAIRNQIPLWQVTEESATGVMVTRADPEQDET